MLTTPDLRLKKIELSRLVLRVGYWMSASDPRWGRQTAYQEKAAVRKAIFSTRAQMKPGPLAEILDLLIAKQDEWVKEEAGLERIPAELKALEPYMTQAYREIVYDVALAAAVSHRERSNRGVWVERILRPLRQIYHQKKSRLSENDYMSVSSLEKSALNELANALSLPHRILV